MPERQCAGCRQKDAWGCKAEQVIEDGELVWKNPASMPLDVDGEQTFACPRQHIFRNPVYWHKLLKYYAMYKQGFLPQAGAVADQSNKAVELFKLMDITNSECDNDLAAQDNRPRGDPYAGRAKK